MFEVEKKDVFEIIAGYRNEIGCLKIESFFIRSENFNDLKIEDKKL